MPKIPTELVMQYEYVRRLGYNTFDQEAVAQAAQRYNFLQLAGLDPWKYNLVRVNHQKPRNHAFHNWCDQKGLPKV